MSSHQSIDYSDLAGNNFQGELYIPINPTSNSIPAVLIFPAFLGITNHEMEKGKKLSEETNFITFVADVYGKKNRPKNADDGFSMMKNLVDSRVETLKPRLEAAFNVLKSNKLVDQTKISIFGYCFGGLCALDCARFKFDARAIVSFHGTLSPIPNLEITPIRNDTTIQIHHGDEDSHINSQVSALQQELRDRKADFIFLNYSKAKHAFTWPASDSFNKPGVGYNKKADQRSWINAINLLQEVSNSKV